MVSEFLSAPLTIADPCLSPPLQGDNSLLLLAATYGRVECVKALLAEGLDKEDTNFVRKTPTT